MAQTQSLKNASQKSTFAHFVHAINNDMKESSIGYGQFYDSMNVEAGD
jgi:hypothetical protein